MEGGNREQVENHQPELSVLLTKFFRENPHVESSKETILANLGKYAYKNDNYFVGPVSLDEHDKISLIVFEKEGVKIVNGKIVTDFPPVKIFDFKFTGECYDNVNIIDVREVEQTLESIHKWLKEYREELEKQLPSTPTDTDRKSM